MEYLMCDDVKSALELSFSLLDWASRLGTWISLCNGFVLEVGVRRQEAALTRDLRWADRPSPPFSSFECARLVSWPLTGQYWCKTCHNYLPPCLSLLGILITEVSGIPQSEVMGFSTYVSSHSSSFEMSSLSCLTLIPGLKDWIIRQTELFKRKKKNLSDSYRSALSYSGRKKSGSSILKPFSLNRVIMPISEDWLISSLCWIDESTTHDVEGMLAFCSHGKFLFRRPVWCKRVTRR